MSKDISVDGYNNEVYAVSDAEYAGIDWGSSSGYFVRFTAEDGSFVVLNLAHVVSISVPGAEPPPGSYPGWLLYATGVYGSVAGVHVNQLTKEAIVDVLSTPGSEDSILEFTALEGREVKVPTANVTSISLVPEDLIVPV